MFEKKLIGLIGISTDRVNEMREFIFELNRMSKSKEC